MFIPARGRWQGNRRHRRRFPAAPAALIWISLIQGAPCRKSGNGRGSAKPDERPETAESKNAVSAKP
jgi:hypothetical protein